MNRPQISIPRSEALVSAAGKSSARMGKGFPECRRPRKTRSSWIRDIVRAEPGAGERWAKNVGGNEAMLSGSRAQGEGDLSEGVEKGERVREDESPRGAPSAPRGRPASAAARAGSTPAPARKPCVPPAVAAPASAHRRPPSSAPGTGWPETSCNSCGRSPSRGAVP